MKSSHSKKVPTWRDSFLLTQWRTWLFSLFKRISIWHLYRYPFEGVLLAKNLWRHRVSLSRKCRVSQKINFTCTVILLSHNRPQNMQIIIQSALANKFISRIIVSNSNKAIKISEWVRLHDERLFLIDELKSTQPGHRFELALNQSDNHFMAVDDDIFLTPHQWSDFFEALLSNEKVPHGITGNIFRPGTISSNGSPFHHITEADSEVDVLIGAYAFTRNVAEATKNLAKLCGFPELSQIRNGEDIILSLAGEGRPLIHNLGRLFCCSTMALDGVALSKGESNFWKAREKIYHDVLEKLHESNR